MSVFWDSSALVHLLCDQGRTRDARAFLKDHPKMVVWWGSNAECASALARLERDGEITAKQVAASLSILATLRSRWFEVVPTEELLQRAMRLPRLHAVCAADAFQLAAALVARGERNMGFLTCDERLGDSALREGFELHEW